MANLTVGPTSTFPTIAAAMAAAAPGDVVILEAGYGNETATVTQTGMTVTSGPSSTGISLNLGAGVATFTLGGTAPINVLDALDGDNIIANGGNNTVTVTGGADAVEGGLGTDRLIVDYSASNGAVTGDSTSNFAQATTVNLVTINGGFEHFTILTGAGADTLTTGAGDDIIIAGDGANTITAGEGANFIVGGGDADVITAGGGGNFIDGGGGTNTITSLGGDDIIIGGIGADTVVAGGGNDVITVLGGGDTISGEAGTDRLIVDYAAFGTPVTGGITGGSLAAGYTGQITTGGNVVDFTGIENLTVMGGSGADVILAGDGTDALSGDAGNDRFTGAGGNDALDGGADTDTAVYTGARSNYTLIVLSPNSIRVIDNRPGSPDGTDTLTDIERLEFTDQTLVPVIAPINDNLAMAENATNAGTVAFQDLNGQAVTYAIAGGVDGAHFTINSTTGALTFKAGPDFEEPTDGGANNVYDVNVTGTHGGGASETRTIHVTVTNVDGNDIIGTKGADIVNLKKTVKGQPKPTGEEDSILGRAGNDKLSGLGGNDNIVGGRGNDKLNGNAGDDTLNGGKGDDVLGGQRGDDVLKGGKGSDIMAGNAANDTLSGGAGADRLRGNAGDDLLGGGGGRDVLKGGDGADTFFFSDGIKRSDIVKDFGAGDMVLLDKNTFSNMGVGPLSQADFDEHFAYKNGKLSYDADGAGGDKGFVFATFSNKADIGASDILIG